MALEQFFGRIVDVVRRTDGDELVAAAGISDTVLYIGDTADFDETGGELSFGGTVYTYDVLDHDANTITLNTGILTAGAVGDRVDVIDTESGQIVVEYVANVLLEDQDPSDQPIEVTVQHALVDLLVEAVRGGASESVTLLRDGEDDLMIWQVDGKEVVNIALETAVDGIDVSLQDLYDQANANAAAAALAEYTATVAQATADGKNTVTYSNSTPGSTSNKAGDIWFQRDGTPLGGIIAQFEGQGGTSWASRALRNEVIANLDAGKLTAGTAFTNALHVKTNFTLGDASTNGIIQSYNFAGSPVGVYIDKYGLVAKGGSVAGATITGGSFNGGTIYIDGAGAAASFQVLANGQMVNKRTATFQDGINTSGGASQSGIDVTSGIYVRNKGGQSYALHVIADGASIAGGLTATGGGSLGGTYTGGFTNSGQIHGNTLWSDADSGGSNSGADIGADGKVKRTVSSKRYKKNIRNAIVDVAAVLSLKPKRFQRKDEGKGGREYLGLIAEDVEAAGLDHLVFHNAEGLVEGVHYSDALVTSLLAVCQSQQAQIDALTARVEALEP